MSRRLLLAEFEHATPLLEAARALAAERIVIADAFTPFPVDGLDELLPRERGAVAWITGLAGVAGAAFGYWLQWYTAVVSYPFYVGGKPLHSWPAFLPVTFELGVLFASFGAFLGMLFLNGLPRLHHPLFDAQRFSLATRDRFFLAAQVANDADAQPLADRLAALGARRTEVVSA